MNMVIEKEIYDELMGVEQENILTNCNSISTFQTTFLISGKLYCLAGEEIAKEIEQKENECSPFVFLTSDIFF